MSMKQRIDVSHVQPPERRQYYKLIAMAAYANFKEHYSDADLFLYEANHYPHRPKIKVGRRKDEAVS